jgi:hypothetical protein
MCACTCGYVLWIYITGTDLTEFIFSSNPQITLSKEQYTEVVSKYMCLFTQENVPLSGVKFVKKDEEIQNN